MAGGHRAPRNQPCFKVATGWRRKLSESLFTYRHLPQGLLLGQEPRNPRQYDFQLLPTDEQAPGEVMDEVNATAGLLITAPSKPNQWQVGWPTIPVCPGLFGFNTESLMSQ